MKYINNSNQYQLVGNYQAVLFEGSRCDAILALEEFQLDESVYCILDVVAPNGEITGQLIKPEKHDRLIDIDLLSEYRVV